jgi:hypothetical protein
MVSFMVARACRGVLVLGRRATQTSRSGTSKVLNEGCGTVRFQKVYKLRRYSPAPVDSV